LKNTSAISARSCTRPVGRCTSDGANLNAQVGIARPGDYGADVSHLNLHKTFCIPHGGGGPGMGPIGVKAHLAAFLPGHPLEAAAAGRVGPVSGRSLRIRIDPADLLHVLVAHGCSRTQAGHRSCHCRRPTMWRRDWIRTSRCSTKMTKDASRHECIIDPRDLQKTVGVTVDDIAKRLIDYGFHATDHEFPGPRHAHDRAH